MSLMEQLEKTVKSGLEKDPYVLEGRTVEFLKSQTDAFEGEVHFQIRVAKQKNQGTVFAVIYETKENNDQFVIFISANLPWATAGECVCTEIRMNFPGVLASYQLLDLDFAGEQKALNVVVTF